ncbi:MAG: BadF/BadG/BcrA/BcrD ATPase family protein [Bergeyella zoohelcum]|nr:BadF/BadG/BcrA/BcrD ATPase family protein [Bergeyella zoohelcum]
MIAIVDGGSTKCDWVLLDNQGEMKTRIQTMGLNPNIVPVEKILTEVQNNEQLSVLRFNIERLFFYGAGCGLAENREKLKDALVKVFPNAEIVVESDLSAAAYAAYQGNPAIICILGTGSNSCYFDGETIQRKLPSLGFLIGDEGSGCALGKLLLKNYFMKKMPSELALEFEQEYPLDIAEVIRNMYHNPRANAYLADFSKFIVKRKQHPYLQNLVYQELKNYMEYQVVPYEESKTSEINFIGSIAYYYQDILRAVASDMNLKIGKIVQKPIENLVDYHKKYIIFKD